MELSHEIDLYATLDEIWGMLNDSNVLRRGIPGFTKVEKKDPDKIFVVIRTAIWLIDIKFSTVLSVVHVVPSTNYLLTGKGQSGMSGFSKDTFKIELKSNADDALVRFTSQNQRI